MVEGISNIPLVNNITPTPMPSSEPGCIEAAFKALFDFEDTTAAYFQEMHATAKNGLFESNAYLDKVMEPNALQSLLDTFYDSHLKPILNHKNLVKFNKWMDSNGQGEWYEQLGIALAKLPLRTVHVILSQVYSLLEGLTHALVHPLDAMHEAAGYILDLIYSLTKGETYSRAGSGMVGAALGQPLVLLQPPVWISVAVGSALVISVLAHDILKSMVQAEEGQGWEAVKTMFKTKHFKPILEGFAVGLITGIATGAINRLFFTCEAPKINFDNPNWPTEYLKSYLKENNYGENNWIWREYMEETNTIMFSWVKKPADATLSSWTGMWCGKIYDYSNLALPSLEKAAGGVAELIAQAVTQFLLLGIKNKAPAEVTYRPRETVKV